MKLEQHFVEPPHHAELCEKTEVRQEKTDLIQIVRVTPERKFHPFLQAEIKKLQPGFVLMEVDLRRRTILPEQFRDRLVELRRFRQQR